MMVTWHAHTNTPESPNFKVIDTITILILKITIF